jgi:AcrR family transcriptional regulator
MGIQERKERERERRRQQIMVAAKNVFFKKGLARSTMEDIAREAELSSGTLYLYFKNKDELYASLSLRILQYLIIRIEEVKKQEEKDLKKRLDFLRDAIHDVYEFDSLMLIKIFHFQSNETFQNLTTKLQSKIKKLSRQTIFSLASLFEDEIDNKKVVDTNPLVLAEMVWAIFSGVILLEENKKILANRKSDLKAALSAAFDLFFQGICKK